MIVPIGLSPNIERDDVTRALSVLFSPWMWRKGNATEHVRDWFRLQYQTRHVSLFVTGRSALTALLESMGIGVGDEVILQAFTCMVVPNAIVFSGARPVFVDIDTSGNCEPNDIEKKITTKTKAIIVQHTFGNPANMDAIIKIARAHRIKVIEDCAHSLGTLYKKRPAGTIGDAAFFSFGRDKCLSSIFGGAAIVRNDTVGKRLQLLEEKASQPSHFWIVQQLLHPIATWMILPIYTSGVGKGILVLLQKLHMLSFPVEPRERRGEKPNNYTMRYPNALASLFILQLTKLDRYVDMRRRTAQIYSKAFAHNAAIIPLAEREGACPLRFAVRVRNQPHVLLYAKQHGIILGNWYHAVLDPAGSDVTKVGYVKGSCPKAEKLAGEIINLPTRIAASEAAYIVQIIQGAMATQ